MVWAKAAVASAATILDEERTAHSVDALEMAAHDCQRAVEALNELLDRLAEETDKP